MAKKKTEKKSLSTVVDTDNNPLVYKDDFEMIYGIISAHKRRAMSVVHNESLRMLWEVGACVSDRLKRAVWGDKVIRMLADYIRTRNPKAKGWSYSTIYRMVKFYDIYSSKSFAQLVNHYGLQNYLLGSTPSELPCDNESIVPIRSAQLPKNDFVSIELTQFENDEFVPFETTQIPNVLFSTGWSNHQLIMRQCKTNEQRLFYILYAGHEQLEYLEALDQEERRSNENPSIGIILCKDANMEVVRYALNRSMSPTMVALYKEQLQAGSVIQRSLEEFCKFVNKGRNS